MRFTHTQYAQALYESFQDTKPKDYDTIIENFFQVLQKNGDLNEYEKIIAVYEEYDRQQRGIKEMEVITAGETKLNKTMVDELNRIAGADIEIKQKIDRNLIGGVVIKVEDTLIDGSIRNHLNNLHDTLTE
jgi:F-type H+-transporting ATPase subunit delta